MELKICKSLNWELSIVTPYAILDALFECLKVPKTSPETIVTRHLLFRNVCESSIMKQTSQMASISPSKILIYALNSLKDDNARFKDISGSMFIGDEDLRDSFLRIIRNCNIN